MCTVTIVPKGNSDFVLTSNRDEAPDRLSISPEYYNIKGVKMLFPKDVQSGGTWIGVSENKRMLCVLNGGFTSHIPKVLYRKSRGVVATDFMAFKNIKDDVKAYNFYNIAPFTMIIADWNLNLCFFELVWDGTKAHFKTLTKAAHIWSSSTLYSARMKEERFRWFTAFKSEHKLEKETLLHFHKTAGSGNIDYGVIMNRDFVKTTSITQVEKNEEVLKMHYENLQNNTVSNKQF
ncbi:NRDE family protein [Mariniflexile ostreae]|uniref:NRDE family protein n=1 Tax=Mariniflexile ostreae TaxID=1520892 RepID=A0ABV5F8D4_9FLAO